MKDKKNCHTPVLVDKSIELLSLKPHGRYIDGTIGYGGHTKAILSKNKSVKILGVDQDTDAINQTKAALGNHSDRLQIKNGNFSSIKTLAEGIGWESVDGVLLDLGVSSPQIDNPSRGFSFQRDGLLDMRMNRQDRCTASSLLNHIAEKDLIDLFKRYGEERRARRIARAIVERRAEKPWERTVELADFIKKTVHEPVNVYSRTVARCFQALRIAVNDELAQLEDVLDAAVYLLVKGGRLVVISFHSLEDRMVKNKFRFEASTCTCPPSFPICRCDKRARLKIVTKHPLIADERERALNSRSAPAKLRAAEKI